jgi:hypothetical protein
MHNTINHVLAVPLDIGWKALTVLTVVSMADMTRQILRRTRHLRP